MFIKKTDIRNQPVRSLQNVRHIILDLDGTIYNGHTLFPFIKDFLDDLKNLQVDYTFLTNNSSLSVTAYIRKLRRMGLPVKPTQVYTSAQATIDYLQRRHPAIKRIYLVGTQSLRREFIDSGFTVVGDDLTNEPDAVIVGFDTSLTFQKLCGAAYWIKTGKLFIATHPDLTCPTDQDTVLVDCGAVCAALKAATGKKPSAVLGKPDPSMIKGIMQRFGLKKDEVAIVGDRLYTDIKMARQAGIASVLVLSGETTQADLQESPILPDYVLENVGELSKILRQSRK